MIVNTGKDDVASKIAAAYTVVKVGNGGDATAASQDALDAYVAQKSVTPSRIGSHLVWTVDFLGSELGNHGVSELGVFDTSDTLLSRVTFTNTGIVANAYTLTLTIRIEVA